MSSVFAMKQSPVFDSNAGPKPTTNPIFKTIYSMALILAGLTFLVGFALYMTELNVLADDETPDAEKLNFIQSDQNRNIYYASNIILYIIFGLAQLVATNAMSDRFRNKNGSYSCSDQLISIGHGLGIIWSTLVLASGMIGNIGTDAALTLLNEDPEGAVALWRVTDTIRNSVGGGNEIVGGFWVLVVSLSEYMRIRQLSTESSSCCDFWGAKVTSLLGLVAGIAGIVHAVPGLDDAAAVFGVTMIVWYITSGFLLYFTKNPDTNTTVIDDKTNPATDDRITV